MNIPASTNLKKKPLIIISTIIFGILTMFAIIKNNMDIQVSTKNYIALGDSISTGYGLEHKENAFTNLLADDLEKGDNYYNFAIDGNTSDDLLNRLSEEEVIDKIKNSELVTISIGGNDILRLFRTFKDLLNVEFLISVKDIKEVLNNPVVLAAIAVSLEGVDLQTPYLTMLKNYEQNLGLIINKIKEVNPETRIMIQTVYNPLIGIKEYKIIERLVDTLINGVNQIILKHAEGNYDIIDTYSEFYEHAEDYTNIKIMDIHPSINGHKVIREMIIEKITEEASIQ